MPIGNPQPIANNPQLNAVRQQMAAHLQARLPGGGAGVLAGQVPTAPPGIRGLNGPPVARPIRASTGALQFRDFAAFQQHLQQEVQNHPAGTPAHATAQRNLQRAEVLYRHYRLGNDVDGPRILHRRGQQPQEMYRNTASHFEGWTRMEGGGTPTGNVPMLQATPRMNEAYANAERHGFVYNPLGVQARLVAEQPPPPPGAAAAGGAPAANVDAAHDMQSNFAWLMGAMHNGESFDLVGPVTQPSVERGSTPGEASALLREVRALVAHGYVVTGVRQGLGGVPIISMAPGPGFNPANVTMASLNAAAPVTMPTAGELQNLTNMGLYDAGFDASPEALAVNTANETMTRLERVVATRERNGGTVDRNDATQRRNITTWSGGNRINGDNPILNPPQPPPGED